MPKIIQVAFNAVCQAKRNAEFGRDTFIDGRTYLQDSAIRTIFRTYPIRNVVQIDFSAPYLNYTVHTTCNRLLLFKIDELGLFVIKTIPFFGGNNTSFKKPIVLSSNTQSSCL
nr:hypothetical protein [Pedobacter sp. ASV2]